MRRYLLEKARTTAANRATRFGVSLSPSIQRILLLPPEQISLFNVVKILVFLTGGAFILSIRLFFYYLVDWDTPQRKTIIDNLRNELAKKLSSESRVTCGFLERRLYSRNISHVPTILNKMLFRTTPFLVVQAKQEQDIIEVLHFAADHKLSVYPRGVASSAFGGTTPTRNGIVLDLSCMQEIGDLDLEKMVVSVEPGVRWSDLLQHLQSQGVTLHNHPSSLFSTVGGWVATGGCGLHSFSSGSIKSAVSSLRMITPGGKTVTLSGSDPELGRVIGSEGQLGVFSRIQLDVRGKAESSYITGLSFSDHHSAFRFIEWAADTNLKATHLVYYDKNKMNEERQSLFDKTGREINLFEIRDTVLIHSEVREIRDLVAARPEAGEANELTELAALYLWNERYFPLKGQRLGPTMLAAEVLLDLTAVPGYIDQVREQLHHFGKVPSIECIASGEDGRFRAVVIASFTTDSKRKIAYFLHLLAVQIMTGLAMKRGGSPYGIGIWNAPFIAHRYDTDKLEQMKELKHRLDPTGLLNPHKFFLVRTRFRNVFGWGFRPKLFSSVLFLLREMAPLISMFVSRGQEHGETVWEVPPATEGRGIRLIEETAQRCTFCGSCIRVCPAYALTDDELVTARAKLFSVDYILRARRLEAQEAYRCFRCIRCGLCEEVCQTRLPLRECYDIIEKQIASRFGDPPADYLHSFLSSVDQNRAWLETTYHVDLADWSPSHMTGTLPGTTRRTAHRE